MKTPNRTLTALLAAGLTLGIAGSAFAFSSHGHGCDMHSRHASPMRAVYQLDSLSDEQRTEIKKLMKEERSSMRELMDSMQDNRDELQDAMRKNITADKIEPLAKKQGDLIAKMMIARVKLRDKINNVLTEKQRTELNRLKSQKYRDSDDRGHGNYRDW